MTPTEAAALLTVAAAFDNRKPDLDAAKAWSLALNGLDFTACRDAIVTHYATTTDRLMPAHIRTMVRRARAKRIAADDAYSPPPGLDPDRTGDYAAWLVANREAAANGEPPPPMPPASIRGRNVLRELGADRHFDPEPAKSVRDALREAQDAKRADAAAERARRDAHNAAMAAARDADAIVEATKLEVATAVTAAEREA